MILNFQYLKCDRKPFNCCGDYRQVCGRSLVLSFVALALSAVTLSLCMHNIVLKGKEMHCRLFIHISLLATRGQFGLGSEKTRQMMARNFG